MGILTIGTLDWSIAGVVEAGTVFEEIACERSANARRYVESPAPMVERATGGRCPNMIVAGIGSAAFTGPHAGLVIARALSCAWGVPLYGVSSLETLALGGVMRGSDDILAVIDARRREFFVL